MREKTLGCPDDVPLMGWLDGRPVVTGHSVVVGTQAGHRFPRGPAPGRLDEDVHVVGAAPRVVERLHVGVSVPHSDVPAVHGVEEILANFVADVLARLLHDTVDHDLAGAPIDVSDHGVFASAHCQRHVAADRRVGADALLVLHLEVEVLACLVDLMLGENKFPRLLVVEAKTVEGPVMRITDGTAGCEPTLLACAGALVATTLSANVDDARTRPPSSTGTAFAGGPLGTPLATRSRPAGVALRATAAFVSRASWRTLGSGAASGTSFACLPPDSPPTAGTTATSLSTAATRTPLAPDPTRTTRRLQAIDLPVSSLKHLLDLG
mmetsp:Transcript_2270/g.5317  ORF Transcript_2270/g.5317 Transcript_2270/m.5317 type:complete len:323 (+) Transcript_2270:923-1891(+)